MNYNIEEELFCTNFELRNLSDLLVYGKAERWVYKFMHKIYEDEHLHRYQYAMKYTAGKNILDIACGSGYGSYMLATEGNCKSVTGVDLDKDAIRYGSYRYPNDNLKRFVGDATEFKHTHQFDVIVSFETIEHIPDFTKFIDNLHENLTDDGLLLISTPITKKTNTTPNNPFHVIEWNFFDFHELFKNKFEIVETMLQDVTVQKENNRQEYTIKNRILNRISKQKTEIVRGKNIEKYENQYDMNLCTSGYQLLVLRKKI